MRLLSELSLLARRLAESGIEYAVFGGLAMAIHGLPRLTVDIDIMVAAEDVAKAIEIAVDLGFDDVSGWVPLPKNDLGINRLFRLNKIADNEFLTLDLLEADSSENAILLNRMSFEIEGQKIQSLSRAALIRMKSSSERTKDKLDVELLQDESD